MQQESSSLQTQRKLIEKVESGLPAALNYFLRYLTLLFYDRHHFLAPNLAYWNAIEKLEKLGNFAAREEDLIPVFCYFLGSVKLVLGAVRMVPIATKGFNAEESSNVANTHEKINLQVASSLLSESELYLQLSQGNRGR